MASVQAGDLFGVEGLVAVVTGGGTGIGLMITQALEANGATVYILGRREETLQTAAKTAKHGRIIPIVADVSQKSTLVAAADRIKAETGFVNLVVANSGISGPGFTGLPQNPTVKQIQEHMLNWDTGSLEQVYAVNNVGIITTVAAFLELLDEGNKKGNVEQKSQVVAISSVGGFSRSSIAGYAYGSSKAAVTHLIKSFSTAFLGLDIRANVIAPGIYPSQMADGIVEKMNQSGWPRDFVPLRRAGDIKDMAGAILYLASRAGAYVNGNVVVTDGGRLGGIASTY